MALLQTGIAKSAAEDYAIDQSLRFDDGDTACLSRTPGSASDRKTWTWSGWVKRSDNDYGILFGAGDTEDIWNSSSMTYLGWTNGGDSFEFYSDGTTIRKTTQLFRDFSGWGHLVLAVDTTISSPAGDRTKVYWNGAEITDFSASNDLSEDELTYVNNTINHVIGGQQTDVANSYYDGYLAEVNFIDGQALDPSSFGETDSTTNQWKPKEYTGSYGTNGFYQKYSSTELANSFTDSSGGFMPTAAIDVEYLIVGGGGGAGRQIAGGGGAGGYRTNVGGTAISLTSGVNYTVTVGAGGSGSADVSSTTATSGGNSSLTGPGITTISASGGGAGSSLNASGVAGGSGGGAAIYSSTGGTGNSGGYSPVEGYAGGNSTSGGGGGGGASEVGANSPVHSGGDGGDGVANSITGASVTYAGGGGGGGRTDGGKGGTAGAGGSGGGGAGTNDNSAPVAGTDGLGGGGGASGYYSGSSNGADGGSGVVIISYISTTAKAVGGTITSYTDGGDTYQVHTFTSSAAPHTITANGDVANTRAQQKVGDSSILFDGTGDYLSVPASSDWDFGTDDFTWEFWWRFDDVTTTDQGFVSVGTGVVDSASVYYQTSGKGLAWVVDNTDYLETGEIFSNDTWYHIAFVKDSGTSRLYVDGVQQDSVSDSLSYSYNEGLVVGRMYPDVDNYYAEGCMDEVRISDTCRYPDGTTFTPQTTEFTADSNTLLLIHSNWTGGLGADSSGNGNAFAVTNLVATDQMTGESPTNNFCTLNPLDISIARSSNLSEGNLQHNGAEGYYQGGAVGTIYTDKKIYYEIYVLDRYSGASSNNYAAFGFAPDDYHPSEIAVDDAIATKPGESADGLIFVGGSGNLNLYQDDSTTRVSQTAIAAYEGSVVMMALDPESGKFWIGVDGTWHGSGDPGAGTNEFGTLANTNHVFTAASMVYTSTDKQILNFGQDSSFAGNLTAQGNQDDNEIGDFYHDVPAGFLALCTSNLSAPEIADPTDHFNPVKYVGTGGTTETHSVTGVGFQPDFLWIKDRTNAYPHFVYDYIRGTTKYLIPNLPDDEDYTNQMSSFDADGFTVSNDGGSALNALNANIISWNWKGDGVAGGTLNQDGTIDSQVNVNTTAGFSIVKYTGNDTGGATVGHGLSQAPNLTIVKPIDLTSVWKVNSDSFAMTDVMYLNETAAAVANIGRVSAFGASTFTLASSNQGVNSSSYDYIAYCFHSVEGYSKVGSYEGNGDADGAFVYTGFRPAFVMTKSIDSTSDWQMFDNKRAGYNADNYEIEANDNATEDTSTNFIDIVSNGFKNRIATDPNVAETYLYIAFAETPFKTANAR